VTIEVTPLSEYAQQLTTLLAGGQLGDGWWATPFSLLYSFSSRGVVKDLRDLAKEAGESLDAFFPVNIKQLTLNDALIGWPLGTHAGWSSMYLNLDAWEEAGAAVPQWEWKYTDEWLEAVQAATTQDRFGFMFSYQSQAAYTFIRSWGGDWIDPANGTESLVNSPETTEALLFMHSLVHQHRVSPPEEAVLPGDTSTTFVNGLTASWAQGVFAVNTVESAVGDQFEWTTASMPAGPGGDHGSFVGIDSLCMNADTQHPEATFEWFLWLTSVESGLAQMEAGLPPTTRMETWDIPEIAENPHLLITRQWLEEVGPITFPANARVSELNTAFIQGFQALMLESDDPEAAIERIHQEVQAVLEQPGF
jgi:ABC-type glycerol-3-phosphate transport system substrate-binding protein